MRYNVHSPCAFHSRIAKSLGVLVGAALVATLILPTAAQAQAPAAPMVSGSSGAEAAITATWGQRLGEGTKQNGWMIEHTEPWRRLGRCDDDRDH